MKKKNCWEFMQCRREPGGENVHELGICPAALPETFDERPFWVVAGTFCGDEVQCTFARKLANCMECDFKEMKFYINFDYMPEYVLIKTEGEALVSDFDDMITKIVDSARWVTGTSMLVDHRKLMVDNLTSNNMYRIKDIAKNHSEKMGKGHIVFVVKDAIQFGNARMYELIGGKTIHQEIEVFYSTDEAVEWLKQQKQYNKEA